MYASMFISQSASHAVLRETVYRLWRRYTPRIERISYHCNGNESNLSECDHSDYIFYECAGKTSAGIICSSMFQGTFYHF